MKRSLIPALHLSAAVAVAYPLVSGIRPPDSGQRVDEAPWLLAAMAPLMLVMILVASGEGRLDSRWLALLGVLAGSAALMRLPFSFAGGNLFFVLPCLVGYTFGGTAGFLLGSLGMAASAVITGGIGPWLPFQMLAAGWVGAGASIASAIVRPGSGRPRIAAACVGIYGYAAAFFYGAVTNLYFWPVMTSGSEALHFVPGAGFVENISRYASFYVITSAAWDAVGGFVNLMAITIVAVPTIRILDRFRRRFSIQPL